MNVGLPFSMDRVLKLPRPWQFQNIKMDIQHSSKSILNLFFIRGRHWNYLRAVGPILMHEDDTASRRLLQNRARANDTAFFTELKTVHMEYNQREVIAAAFERNHIWFAKNWPDPDKAFALYEKIKNFSRSARHEACYYGRPELVQALLDTDAVNVNLPDPEHNNRLPLFVCHMNADHSWLNDGFRKQEWMSELIYASYERDLLQQRYLGNLGKVHRKRVLSNQFFLSAIKSS